MIFEIKLTGDEIINIIDDEIKSINYSGDIILTNTETKKQLIIKEIKTIRKEDIIIDILYEKEEKKIKYELLPSLFKEIIEDLNINDFINNEPNKNMLKEMLKELLYIIPNPEPEKKNYLYSIYKDLCNKQYEYIKKIIYDKNFNINDKEFNKFTKKISKLDNRNKNIRNYLKININNDDLEELGNLKDLNNERYLLKLLKKNNCIDLYNKYNKNIIKFYNPSKMRNYYNNCFEDVRINANIKITLEEVVDYNEMCSDFHEGFLSRRKKIYYENSIFAIINKYQNEIYLVWF